MSLRLPVLFQELESRPTYADRKRYVRDELIEMARSGTLWMTAIMNQRQAARCLAGEVIFGHGISDGSDGHPPGTHVTGEYVPSEIADAKIELEAIAPYKTIEWVDGTRPVDDVIVGSSGRYSVARREDDVRVINAPRATVSPRVAWLALKQYGENVAFAPLAADKAAIWRVREVRAKGKA